MTQFPRPTPAALDYDSAIIGALELSEKKWVLAVQLPGVKRHTRPPWPISSVASLNCETELPNFLPFRGNTKAWLREIGKANNRMASLVGAVAFTGTLTRGSIGIIPATAETENTRRYREDRWLGNWIRTKIDGARVRDSNIASCRLMLKTRSSRQAHLVVSRQLFRKEFMIR